jgi:hypothetical protein
MSNTVNIDRYNSFKVLWQILGVGSNLSIYS